MIHVADSTGAGDARFMGLPDDASARFNRIPFGYEHTLSGLDLFYEDALDELARRYDHDYFIAASARSAGTRFYDAGASSGRPHEALRRLDDEQYRILLKRPEQYDARYGALTRRLFQQILAVKPLAPGERVVRLDSSILVSSAGTITPFHFDPEISHFFQIAGEKTYHLYPPAALGEAELERFYRMGIVNIGQVDLAGRDPGDEHVFDLRAGLGMHQPQNAPHWVRTGPTRTISFVIAYETQYSRATGRARAFNYYQRRLGLVPSAPGRRPQRDAAKARIMAAAIPLRKAAGNLARACGRR